MTTAKIDGFLWLVYPEYRKLRIPYAYNGHSYMDTNLPAPSDGRFLGKSPLGPYFLVRTRHPRIQLVRGWQALRQPKADAAFNTFDPRCAFDAAPQGSAA